MCKVVSGDRTLGKVFGLHESPFSLQEFFTEDLWHALPSSWQPVLQDLSYPQVADLLLDAAHGDRRYHRTLMRPEQILKN